MFLCTYIVLKASSCVTFSVFFATRASIVCIDSGTCDTIRVSLALAIRFFDISINRYTPNNIHIKKTLIKPLASMALWLALGLWAMKYIKPFNKPAKIFIIDEWYSLQWCHMSIMAFQITSHYMFVQQFVQANIKETSNVRNCVPL